MRHAPPAISLRARALQYLARREYSRAELRVKLLHHVQIPHAQIDDDSGQLQPPDLEALLDDLSARGWLSDARATAQLIHAKRGRFGAQRISHELHQRGISDELIEAALPELRAGELEAARAVWQRKFGRLPQDAKEKARHMRFLQSRGFSTGVIFKVLQHSDDND